MHDIEELQKIRRIIDAFKEYELIEDLYKIDNNYCLKVRITINGEGSVYVPKSSDWYIVFDGNDVDFYPSNTNSITATFQHQALNELKENLPFRLGKPCLDTPSDSLYLPSSHYSEPLTGKKFYWYLQRMLKWLDDAAQNKLVKAGDQFELPVVPYNIKEILLYKEGQISDWSDFNADCGYAYLKNLTLANRKYLVLDKIFDKTTTKTCSAPEWGSLKEDFRGKVLAAWIKLKDLPVIKPWQYPKTWEELVDACHRQNISIERKMAGLLNKRLGKISNLLLVAPIPERIGDQPKSYYWMQIILPAINFPCKGFRNSVDGLLHYLKARALKSPLLIGATQNCDDAAIRTRGSVDKVIKELNFCVIGCGALGSMLCESLTRMGIKNLHIIDSDCVNIGNLARHISTLDDIGEFKTESLIKRLVKINPSILLSSSAEELSQNNVDKLSGYDVIIDCTGNNSVVSVLQKCTYKSNKTFYIGAFTYGAKKFCYYRCVGNTLDGEAYFRKTLEFFNSAVEGLGEGEMAWEGIGCYHPVFPAMYSDVSVWANIFANEIISNLFNSEEKLIKYYNKTTNSGIEVVVDNDFSL